VVIVGDYGCGVSYDDCELFKEFTLGIVDALDQELAGLSVIGMRGGNIDFVVPNNVTLIKDIPATVFEEYNNEVHCYDTGTLNITGILYILYLFCLCLCLCLCCFL
jgi:hypothetical protein